MRSQNLESHVFPSAPRAIETFLTLDTNEAAKVANKFAMQNTATKCNEQ